MPERQTLQRAQRDKREGKAPSTQAGEFVREEIHHIREGKHGARSPQQAVAIGLSKARRAGVDLKPPSQGRSSAKTARRATRDYELGHGAAPRRRATAKRRAASAQALEREPRESASSRALASEARSAASRRSGASRSAAAAKAVRTKGPARRSAAAKKAASTRRQHARAGTRTTSRQMHW
ncbi:MAG TPA: hypothetical protein VHX52_09470 [Steroidobacteraceae bacterium]|jgi:hypothetical protein|nr:hypothetical protein [Steroidobacteraceae bacterium]